MKLKKLALTGIALLSLLSSKELNANLNENQIQIANSQKTYKNMNYLFKEDNKKEFEYNGWITYINGFFEFSIRYPRDIIELNTNELNKPSLYRSNNEYTKIAFDIQRDKGKCFSDEPQYGVVFVGVINHNGIEFKVTDEWEDGAMGGFRTINRQYATIHEVFCYKITSTVQWKDIAFMIGATEDRSATPEEIEKQERYIEKQERLNREIIKTFKFIE